ncbi:hypothetical protein [Streptomyces sp. NPDC000405]|uniref:hypothetical protein n=1 Tax=Streptomyces sp. NPDC000405 TaxID=3161033 RepID=UPI00398D3F35
MVHTSGRKGARALSRLTVAAIAAALTDITAGTAAATGPSPDCRLTVAAPYFPLQATKSTGEIYVYAPNGQGAFGDREQITDADSRSATAMVNVDHAQNGYYDSAYVRTTDGTLVYSPEGKDGADEPAPIRLGSGWNIYDRLLSPGNVGGTKEADLLARDKSGVLWLYKGNGKQTDPFENRVRIGGGWGQYNNLF